MLFTQDTVWHWLLSFPTPLAILLGILIVAGLIFLAVYPFIAIKRFNRLDAKMCRPGTVQCSFSRWPAWVALGAAFWVAFPAARELSKKHNPMTPEAMSTFHVVAIDLSDSVPHPVLFGLARISVPSDIAFYLDAFGRLWYVPVLGCLFAFAPVARKFASLRDAAKYLALQLLFANALYWVYGFFLAFVFITLALVSIGLLLCLFGGGLAGVGSGGMQTSGHGNAGGNAPAPPPPEDGKKTSSSGIQVESRDMFDRELVQRNAWGPDKTYILDEKNSSIYGRVYVESESGDSHTETNSDIGDHPTEIRKNVP